MRFALIAAALMFAAPAFADEPIKFPEKIQRTDFQSVFADTGPVYVAGQPSEAGLRDMAAKGVKTVINLRTQREMDNRQQVPYDEAAAHWHGVERARLEALGRPAPYVDGQIAAIAHVNELTLVTANVKDFKRFSGIEVESWVQRPA